MRNHATLSLLAMLLSLNSLVTAEAAKDDMANGIKIGEASRLTR